MTQQIRNIYQRINGVMKKVRYVQKGDRNAALKYSFVSHDSVMAALHDAVTEEGIVILPDVESYGYENNVCMLKMRVDFINIDQPEDKITMKYSIPSTCRGALDEKSFGSTYSYACKYALLKTFMLETGEDADSDERPAQCITESQIKTIIKMLEGDEIKMARILEFNKVNTIEEIPQENYQRVVHWIVQANSKATSTKAS